MKRHLLLFSMAICLVATLASAPPAAAGERVVAVIMPGGLPRHQSAQEAFAATLQAGGFGPGQGKIFVQKPNPDRMSITNSIRRAVQTGADLIVTYGAPAALVAKQEVRKTPVLFADVHDPVALGLVKSLAAPGVEMTGAAGTVSLAPLIDHLLRVKTVKKAGVLFTAAEGGSALQAGEMENLGKTHGFSVVKQDVATSDRAAAAAAEMLGQIDALYLTESSLLAPVAAEVVDQAQKRGVPVISQIPGLAKRGAILNLEADPEEQGKLIAVHALQILAGQKAFILPVRTPKKIELVVNRGAARHLSLALPETVLADATRVID